MRRRGEARRDEAGRGEVRRDVKRVVKEKADGEGRRGETDRYQQSPHFIGPPCSEIDSAGAGINDRDRGGDEDHGDEQ